MAQPIAAIQARRPANPVFDWLTGDAGRRGGIPPPGKRGARVLAYVGVAAANEALISNTFATWRMGGNAILTLWICYILTRPFGAALGDLLTQTRAGGLGMDTAWTSTIRLSVIVLSVGFAQWTTQPAAVQAR